MPTLIGTAVAPAYLGALRMLLCYLGLGRRLWRDQGTLTSMLVFLASAAFGATRILGREADIETCDIGRASLIEDSLVLVVISIGPVYLRLTNSVLDTAAMFNAGDGNILPAGFYRPLPIAIPTPERIPIPSFKSRL